MAAGCKNTRAVNYNPAANPDDYSCVYLLKNQGNCHWFEDYVPPASYTFTMSYAMAGGSWVFFHDYWPDMYIHTRDKLFTAKNSEFYKHNSDRPGKFHNQAVIKPFFIDVVFQSDANLILETVQWMTDYLNTQTVQPFKTLTHITIWNTNQHTSRVPLSKIQAFKNMTARNTRGSWVFNDFRNVLIDKGIPFLDSIFKDYMVLTPQVNMNQAWHKKELLIDKWFCVRFEFDNSEDVQMVLHDTTIQAIKSDR